MAKLLPLEDVVSRGEKLESKIFDLDRERRSNLLMFLIGYCVDDEHFWDGVETFFRTRT